MINTFLNFAQGNPGAAQFLSQLSRHSDVTDQLTILNTIDRIRSLRGTNLYVLWSDIGNRDLDQVAKLCRAVPADVLADACSRQDYSGRDLVKPYLEAATPH